MLIQAMHNIYSFKLDWWEAMWQLKLVLCTPIGFKITEFSFFWVIYEGKAYCLHTFWVCHYFQSIYVSQQWKQLIASNLISYLKVSLECAEIDASFEAHMDVHLLSSVRPRPEPHMADLSVEWEVSNIDGTRTLEDLMWYPDHCSIKGDDCQHFTHSVIRIGTGNV